MIYMNCPAINLAARLVQKKKLVPPINIFSLAEQYSNVELMSIPFDVDGISLNLKVPGKKPHIIINNSSSNHRIRFTLAHELGHVIIPWHLGSIVDKTDIPKIKDNRFDEYWMLEAEANRFASEVLMPSQWVKNIIHAQKYDLHKITEDIVEEADVSSQAATIKIISVIKPGYLFVALNEYNEVIFSGKSEGTLAIPPTRGDVISPDEAFLFCRNRFNFSIAGFNYCWWFFNDKDSIPKSASLDDWRDLLDLMVSDIGIRESERGKFKQSLNGVIAYANSQVRGKDRTQESLYSALLQRINGQTKYKELLKHKKFDSFIYSKIDSLLNR